MEIYLSNFNHNVRSQDKRVSLALTIVAIASIIILALGASKALGMAQKGSFASLISGSIVFATVMGRLFYLCTYKPSPKKGHKKKSSPDPLFTHQQAGPLIVEKQEGPLVKGQGEYIAVHIREGKIEPVVDKYLFDKIYAIFNKYSPMMLLGEEKKLQHRYQHIEVELKALDLTLKAIFIPSTLYAMIYTRKCLEEDQHAGHICHAPYLQHDFAQHRQTFTKYLIKQGKQVPAPLDQQGWQREYTDYVGQRQCWHLVSFKENAGCNDHPHVIEIAYRLNQVIINLLYDTITINKGCLTYDEFQPFVEDHITYLQNHATHMTQKINNHNDQDVEGLSKTCIGYQEWIGNPTSNFGFNWSRTKVQSTAICDDSHASIVRKAIELECSTQAESSVILYRGSLFEEDSIQPEGAQKVKSLSYGMGLFADAFYRGDDAPFHYMRVPMYNAYAIFIPFTEIEHSPFYIPPINTIVSLLSYGDLSHPRTKLPNGYSSEQASGVSRDRNTADAQLASSLDIAELERQFQFYKACRSVILKL